MAVSSQNYVGIVKENFNYIGSTAKSNFSWITQEFDLLNILGI